MGKAWRIAASRSIVKDRWIDLRADRCLTPAGAEIEPYYVLSYPDWVHVVALTVDHRMVLVRQYRHAVGETVVELPGGVIDASDNDPEAAARRELAEETGYGAREWRMVGSFYPNPATHTNRVHVVLALDARPDVSPSLDIGEEGLETLTLPVRDVLAGLPGGLIGQAMHVAAICLGLTAAGHLCIDAAATTPAGERKAASDTKKVAKFRGRQ